MSINEVLLGPKCGVDIYEEPDENVWVDCKRRGAMISAAIAIPITIVVLIICLWAGSTNVKIGASVVCGLFIVLVIVGIFWAPVAARVEHQRFQKELQSYMKDGRSRAQAIELIKKERESARRDQAITSAARTQASANLTGMLGIARALRK
jgi:hypothetical protein